MSGTDDDESETTFDREPVRDNDGPKLPSPLSSPKLPGPAFSSVKAVPGAARARLPTPVPGRQRIPTPAPMSSASQQYSEAASQENGAGAGRPSLNLGTPHTLVPSLTPTPLVLQQQAGVHLSVIGLLALVFICFGSGLGLAVLLMPKPSPREAPTAAYYPYGAQPNPGLASPAGAVPTAPMQVAPVPVPAPLAQQAAAPPLAVPIPPAADAHAPRAPRPAARPTPPAPRPRPAAPTRGASRASEADDEASGPKSKPTKKPAKKEGDWVDPFAQ